MEIPEKISMEYLLLGWLKIALCDLNIPFIIFSFFITAQVGGRGRYPQKCIFPF